MKIQIVFWIFLFIVSNLVSAQEPQNPLSDTYIIQNGGGEEIVGFDWDGVSIYKYYKALEKYSVDTLVRVTSYRIDAETNGRVDMALSDINNDGLQEILMSWSTDHKAQLLLLTADPAKLEVDPENAWSHAVSLSKSAPAVYDPAEWFILSGVLVKAANLDSDPEQEFVVAYWAEDSMIDITAYDVDKDLNISEMGSIRDQLIREPQGINLCEDGMYLFDIECADLNGDGRDEILLSGRQDLDPAGYQIFANIYRYNEATGDLEARARKIVFEQTNAGYDIENFNMASGHFHSPDINTAVIGVYEFEKGVYGDVEANTFVSDLLIPVEIDSGLSEITTGTPVYQRHDSIPNHCYYDRISTLEAEDLNNDGLDELVSAYSYGGVLSTLKLYEGTRTLGFSVFADLDPLVERCSGAVTVGNISKDTGEVQFKEIMINGQFYSNFSDLYQITTHPDGSFNDLVLLKEDCNELYPGKTATILSGNLDNDIRIGKPKRHSVTDILQPLVILNAPPIHFDVFNGQPYDVCRSYNGNQSLFNARYVKESLQSTEVTTEVNRDWSLSASASAGFSFWGVSVSAYLSQTYGDKFSKVDGSTRTVSVGVAIDASVDDQIYATVMDYDLWEYPVYCNDTMQGHVLVVEPKIVKNSWFDSKSWKGYGYIPSHEVGNILSYRRYPMLSDNPLMIEKIKGDYGLETSFLVSGNSSFNWFLNFSDFTENQATTTKEFSRDWGASVSGWGCGISLDGSYNSEDIQTQRTTVENKINMDVHLGAVDMGLGETRYEVTPYGYWASNGALVIDYAADPEVSGPGGVDTWWDTHYGYLPDPAFILPWHYDPEKGNPVSEIKRYQTKDIYFIPEDPLAGDSVTIYANVHNFSLLPTPAPVGVRFYSGDPDNGGTLIEGLGNITEVFTNSIIESRGTETVSLKWKIPENLPAYPRIYAEIDADNQLSEIHEDNNKSWSIMQKTTGDKITDDIEEYSPAEYMPEQNYPNPFRAMTRIRFTIPAAELVTVEVYNMFGQKIETLVNKIMMGGYHEVEFNGANLTPGIYFYSIRTGDYYRVFKMILYK